MTKIFLDIETSALEPGWNDGYFGEILELAIGLEGEDGSYTEHVWRFRPLEPAGHHPESISVNGYNWRMKNYILSDIGKSIQAIHDLLFNRKALIIGHNVQFDLHYLNFWFEEYQIEPIPVRGIDTMTLVHEHLSVIGLHRLGMSSVRSFLGMSAENAHCALFDMRDTRYLYHKLSRASSLNRLMWKLRAQLALNIRKKEE